MNDVKKALDNRLKDITFSQQMKNKVLEECLQPNNVGSKNKPSFKRTLVPITLFLVFCISIATDVKGLKSDESVEELAGEKVSLEPDIVYSQYDVTGDRSTDTVKVEIVNNEDENDSETIQIFVNDKIAFKQKREWGPYWSVELIKLGNGKVFFDIYSMISSDDDRIHQLYTCENNKLKSVYDYQKYYDEYTINYSVDIVKVSGNIIETEVRAQFYTTGSIQYDMNLNFEDGKFERSENSFALQYKAMSKENKWTVNTKIKVYEEAGNKKVAYTLKKGSIVKLDKVVYNNNEVYFQVENNKGEKGYIVAAKTYPDTLYFKEVQHAG